MKKTLFILIVLVFTLSACNKTPAPTPEVETPVVETQTSTGEIEEQPVGFDPYANLGPEVIGQDDLYSLRLPEEFENDNIDNADLDLSLTDEKNGMSFFSVIEPKADVQVANLSEYVDSALVNFATLDRVPLSAGTIPNLNGYTVKDTKFSGTFEGEDVIFYVRVVETPTHYIQLVVATTPDAFEANVTTMTSIIDSFIYAQAE